MKNPFLVSTCVALVASALCGQRGDVTFSRHVAKIVFNKCARCHRPGQVAPFPLLTYDQVKKRARTIAKVARQRLMPPWHPVKGHGRFLGEEARLSKSEIAILDKWARSGRKPGDLSKLPKMPKFIDGWQLGQPDMIVKMPKGFPVPAGGSDIYRNFVIPLDLKKDKWLTAIEVRPSARSVLHHVIFSLDTSGEARRADGRDGKPGFRGMGGLARRINRDQRNAAGQSTSGLGGWAVGGQPRHLPRGLARKLPRGADLVLQSHFHPSGKSEVEQTTLGLFFAKRPPTRTMVGIQLPPMFGVAAGLTIPPGESRFKLTDSFTLPVAAQGVTIGGHAHYLCSQMRVWITPPKGKRKSVFWIDDWDFDWQNRYQYRSPLNLRAGTKIEVEIHYDNSEQNPDQQFDPPRQINWGLQSTDEMGSITMLVVPKKKSDTRELQQAYRSHLRRSFTGERAISGFVSQAISRLKGYDKNGDGKVDLNGEVPRRMRRFVQRLDQDDDGFIDEKEMERAGELGRGRGRD